MELSSACKKIVILVVSAIISISASNIASIKKSHTDFLDVIPVKDIQHIILGYLDMWENGYCTTRFEPSNALACVSVSPDNSQIATGSTSGTLQIWEVNPGKRPVYMSAHPQFMVGTVFASDNQVISAGEYSIKIWDITTQKCINCTLEPTGIISTIAPTVDNNYIISGSNDGSVRLWHKASCVLYKTLSGHSQPVRSVMGSKNSNYIVSGSDDKTVKMWDIKKQTCVATLTGHTGPVNAVAIAPNLRLIVSGSGDKTVKLWDVKKRSLLLTLALHTEKVTTVAFSADSRYIISGSADGIIVIWDIYKNILVSKLSGHTEAITALTIAPNNSIVSTDFDGGLKVWNTQAEVITHGGLPQGPKIDLCTIL